ncbi:type II secretion system F family protein [Psychrobacillus sp. NPDC096426]|uniref:type II secretion system F family protein n=1 Tax=Psychrobacillus sp. NPDC096426 TaxID=3364491 RepID=UPI00381C1D2E
MAYFQYSGRDRKGEIASGVMRAATAEDAKIKLRKKGIAAREIKIKTGFLYQELNIGSGKVPFKDLVIFIRQFSTLIKAGITILDATSILKEQTSQKRLKQVLAEIEEDLREGHPFSVAAEQHPQVFPVLFTNMLKAGEAGGQFDEILDQLAIYYEKQNETKQKVTSAMMYPAVLGVVAIAVVIFMIGFIVPRFAGMFTSFGAELPFITQFLLDLSEVFQSWWWVILLLLLLIIVGGRILVKRDPYRFYFHSFLLRLPIFGPVIQKSTLARMTRTLSSLYAASVPVTHSLMVVGKVVQNAVLEEIIEKSSKSVQEGNSLAAPMTGHWAIPSFVSQMIVLGEKSGTLDFMLAKVADFYEQEVDTAAERLKSLIEPAMILFLAVVIGGIVASIMIPMFSIFTEVQ